MLQHEFLTVRVYVYWKFIHVYPVKNVMLQYKLSYATTTLILHREISGTCRSSATNHYTRLVPVCALSHPVQEKKHSTGHACASATLRRKSSGLPLPQAAQSRKFLTISVLWAIQCWNLSVPHTGYFRHFSVPRATPCHQVQKISGTFCALSHAVPELSGTFCALSHPAQEILCH